MSVEAMARLISPATGKPYGVKRVCEVWGTPRSTYYHRQETAAAPEADRPPRKKRGPKPKVSDEELLKAIKNDLERSPFHGEGHRKVHARLRIVDNIRAGRNRVLRIMRENNLLSPFRVRQGDRKLHLGTITTDAPNRMWGTDGKKVFTLEQGWIWVFSAVEHFNFECVGWHVAKYGSRFAAMEPLKQGLTKYLGGCHRGVGRGHDLKIRMDWGTQYTSDDFRNQLKAWEIDESYAFVSEPETNGVAERFNRVLGEQVFLGKTFKNVEEVQTAMAEFIPVYNAQWRTERSGYLTPLEAREKYFLTTEAA